MKKEYEYGMNHQKQHGMLYRFVGYAFIAGLQCNLLQDTPEACTIVNTYLPATGVTVLAVV